MLLRACGLAAADVEREPDLMQVNAGAAVGQAVGQHLLCAGHFWEEPELYYWAREKPIEHAYRVLDEGIADVEERSGAPTTPSGSGGPPRRAPA